MDTKNKARIEILNYVITFFTKVYFGSDTGILDSDTSFHNSNYKPPIGSIAKMMAAPFTKWYLSWVVDVKEDQVLLESIEDGELCWWTNVMFHHIPLEVINKFPYWKWTDRQFEFRDKWFRACKREYEYSKVALNPKFLDNGNVILGVREKWTNKENQYKEFENWKKLKSKDMQEFFKNVCF